MLHRIVTSIDITLMSSSATKSHVNLTMNEPKITTGVLLSK